MIRGAPWLVLLSLLIAAPVNTATQAGDAAVAGAASASHWPQWRGPDGTGAAEDADPPISWSETKNVRWKVRVPGRGHATPVVWGERIFVTTAEPFGERFTPRPSVAPGAHDNLDVTQQHRFAMLCFDRGDGRQLWRADLNEALPHEGGHRTASLASASPVTDGEHVFAFFGSFGLYCLDLDGEVVWSKQLGRMDAKHGHGEGASPALYQRTLIVNWDHEGQSFVVAFDKSTGEELWRVQRNEVTSWATPIVVDQGGVPQVIICGTDRVRAYHLKTGKVVWECGGLSANIVATPVAGKGMVFAGSSYEKRALLAIRLDGAQGDITGTDQVAWRRIRGTPYVPSPLLYDGGLYFLTHYQGILTRVDAATGDDAPGAFRLSGLRDIYASPVAASGRVYITDLDGATLVISSGAAPRALALNRLDDQFSASPVLVDREIILRGREFLYSLSETAGNAEN